MTPREIDDAGQAELDAARRDRGNRPSGRRRSRRSTTRDGLEQDRADQSDRPGGAGAGRSLVGDVGGGGVVGNSDGYAGAASSAVRRAAMPLAVMNPNNAEPILTPP